MSSTITTFQPSDRELRQLAIYWLSLVSLSFHRRFRLRSPASIAKLDEQTAQAQERLAEIKTLIGQPEYDAICLKAAARLQADVTHPLWWVLDDGTAKRSREFRLSRSDQGWRDVRLAKPDETGITPAELSDAIREINSKD